MNKPIRTVSIFCLLLFLALALNATYLQYYHASALNNRLSNGRVATATFSRARGAIVAGPNGGTVIASSVPSKDQYKYQRKYLLPFMYAPITGWYTFGNETQVMELNPDAITVKPLPSLTLDYFLTRDINADDPFTTEIEAPEPYTLGVRVKNSGMAPAEDLKINSAQPKIIDNQQGLPITFQIIGSYVQDQPTTNSLLIDFGDIAPGTSKMGRWQMESNIAGKFVDFTATFTHEGRPVAALLVNRPRALPELRRLIAKGTDDELPD